MTHLLFSILFTLIAVNANAAQSQHNLTRNPEYFLPIESLKPGQQAQIPLKNQPSKKTTTKSAEDDKRKRTFIEDKINDVRKFINTLAKDESDYAKIEKENFTTYLKALEKLHSEIDSHSLEALKKEFYALENEYDAVDCL